MMLSLVSRSRSFALAVVALLGLAVPAAACNVPVFRYALEHWQPDAYRVVLFHRGSLSPAEQEQLAALNAAVKTTPANVSIRTVNLAAAVEPGDRHLLLLAGNPDLPRLIVQYPVQAQIEQPAWSGSLDSAELAALFDSPSRQEVLRRLIAGQSGVWLLVEGGDAKKDDAAAATLEQALKRLPQTIALPKLTDAPEDQIAGGPALRVEFSLLRVHRDDSAERPLVAMLLGSEPDLAELNEPIVFPVFGRCRALLPLVGAGISSENILESAKFLAGACSCQVKELNPGFDLLIAADWKEQVAWAKVPIGDGRESSSQIGEPEMLPIPSGSKPQSIAESAATIPGSPAPDTATAASERKSFLPQIVIGIAVLVVLLLVFARR